MTPRTRKRLQKLLRGLGLSLERLLQILEGIRKRQNPWGLKKPQLEFGP